MPLHERVGGVVGDRGLPLAAIIPASAYGCLTITQCELQQVVASQHSSGIVISIIERRAKRRHPTCGCETIERAWHEDGRIPRQRLIQPS